MSSFLPRLVFLLLAAGSGLSSVFAQPTAGLSKEMRFVQTTSNVVVPAPGSPFGFRAMIAAIPPPPNSMALPNSSGIRNFPSGGDPSGLQIAEEFETRAQMDAAYPSGTYVMTVGGRSANLAFGGDLYPAPPVATVSGGTFTNGVLMVDRTQPLTITINFPENFLAGSSRLNLSITSLSSSAPLTLGASNVDEDGSFTTNQVAYTIPANTFVPGIVYELKSEAQRIVTHDTTSLEGYTLTAAYSSIVSLTINAAPGTVPPAFTLQPLSQTVGEGSTVIFNAAAIEATGYQWRRDGVNLPGATTETLALLAATAASAGSYTVIATNTFGSTTSAPASLTVQTGPVTPTARLSNLSVRAAVATDKTLIIGFSVAGGSRSILMRGIGPALASFGATGAMADPRLELYDNGRLVVINDDWGNSTTLSAAFTSVGAFPLAAGSRDAALLVPVDGTRAVHLKGTGGGVALVELYDSGPASSARLVNLSTRHQLGSGNNALVVGLFISGTGAKNLLIRAVGPKLVDFGITGPNPNPVLDIFRPGSTRAMLSNDNWPSSLAPLFGVAGAFDLTNQSRDAALVAALSAGAYLVQVSGAGSGEALIEIYELP